MELAGRTSSSETDKFNRSNYWQAPVLRSANKESYVAFCGDILHFNDEDEEDQIARNALEAALYTAERAYTQLPNKWRNPRIATDGGGGVRLTWRLGEKEIRAVFPTSMSRPQYLYVEGDDVPYTIPNFTSYDAVRQVRVASSEQMTESDRTEDVDCTEIVYRALKKSWIGDNGVGAEAFIRKVQNEGKSSEAYVSITRKKYTTARECRSRLRKMPSAASLHVG